MNIYLELDQEKYNSDISELYFISSPKITYFFKPFIIVKFRGINHLLKKIKSLYFSRLYSLHNRKCKLLKLMLL